MKKIICLLVMFVTLIPNVKCFSENKVTKSNISTKLTLFEENNYFDKYSLITEAEYNASVKEGKSYLLISTTFFCLSNDEQKYKIIKGLTINDATEEDYSSIRIVANLKPNLTVTGTGTINNPYIFN